MSSETPPIFGGVPNGESPFLGRLPGHFLEIEWQWLRPLRAILAFLGYSIDEVVSNPRAAAEVRTLWKVYKLAQRLGREARDAERRASQEAARKDKARDVRAPRRLGGSRRDARPGRK